MDDVVRGATDPAMEVTVTQPDGTTIYREQHGKARGDFRVEGQGVGHYSICFVNGWDDATTPLHSQHAPRHRATAVNVAAALNSTPAASSLSFSSRRCIKLLSSNTKVRSRGASTGPFQRRLSPPMTDRTV